jgi:hypothetical protein
MGKWTRAKLVTWLSVLGLLLLSLPVTAAPPGNWTNYNVDLNGDFEVSEGGIHFEGHGNNPDGWPEVMEFWINLPSGCTYYEQWQSFNDNGETLTIAVDNAATDCESILTMTLEVNYDAVRYRSHTNETGGQVKAVGERDESADVFVDITESGDGWETIIVAQRSNVVFYQAVTEQFHNTGTPGNPQP